MAGVKVVSWLLLHFSWQQPLPMTFLGALFNDPKKKKLEIQ
jgi:hypothetical protein